MKHEIKCWDRKGWKGIVANVSDETQEDWDQTLMTKLNRLKHESGNDSFTASSNCKELINGLAFSHTYNVTYSEIISYDEPTPFNSSLTGTVSSGNYYFKIINLY